MIDVKDYEYMGSRTTWTGKKEHIYLNPRTKKEIVIREL